MTTENANPVLYAYLGYQDAPGALRWLEKAFGFEVTMEVPDERGGIMHAELRRGGVAFTLFSDYDGYDRAEPKGETVGHGLYIGLDAPAEVDAVFASAAAAGAEVVWRPEESQWGNYRCRVRDPQGYEWTFGTHVPGLPQTGWDG